MRGRLLTGLAVLTAGLLLLAVPRAGAGWVIEQIDADFPGEATTYSIKAGRVRIDGLIPGLVVLLDLQAGEGYILDEARRKYGGGNLSKVEAAMHKRGGGGRLSDEQISGEGRDRTRTDLPDLRIERSVDAGAVAGIECARYRVLLGDELVEEIWIAPGMTPLGSAKVSALFSAQEIMSGGTPAESWDFPPGYDEHPDYLEVLNSGFPLRRSLFFVGESHTEEIRSARETTLPDALFDIPEGTAAVGYKGLMDLLLGMD